MSRRRAACVVVALTHVLLLALAGGAVPSRARAYCRTTTLSGNSTCPAVCVEEGVPLAWEEDPVYGLTAEPIPGVPRSDYRRIVDESFAAWTQVLCDGQPIDLRVEQQDEPAAEPDIEMPDRRSAVLYHPGERWESLFPGSRRVLALTLASNDSSGRIVGADLHLNGGVGHYTECMAVDRCANADDVDLGNVVTHEAGHFFGLAHSEVMESTMHCDAPGWEVANRTLADDDVAGICAIYGGLDPDEPGAVDEASGCRCDATGGAPSTTAWLLGLALWTRRRLRRREPEP